MVRISAFVIVRNERKTLDNCLKSLAGAVDEIVVVDGKSTDGSAQVARKYTKKVFEREPQGFCEPEKQFALSKTTGEWVLNLDADETLSPELKMALPRLIRTKEFDAYALNRKNYYSETRWLRHGFFYPDYQARLYRRAAIEFPEKVHGIPKINGRIKRENLHILHKKNPPEELLGASGFLRRGKKYALIESRQRGPGVKPHYFLFALLAFPYNFLRDYFLLAGFLDGWPGLKAAVLHGMIRTRAYFYTATGKTR